MQVLQYKDLELDRVRASFEKVRQAIEADDLRTADVKKLHVGSYYRAKLDYANRLLLQFARVHGATVCLALEVIENHDYARSRFLRGAAVDESKIQCEPAAQPQHLERDLLALRGVPEGRTQFQLLDKPIVFDDAQEEAYQLPAPLVLIGSAGSGKTAVTLAKLRQASGRVLFVTLSSYLARAAQELYAAHGYENASQEVQFLSYREFLETLRVPAGREVTMADFRGWCERHRDALRAIGDVDSHALFEEFRGVLGAHPNGPLTLQDYCALGPRQSLLPPEQRPAAHALFSRYRQWLPEAGLFDPNLVAHAWRIDPQALAETAFDFVVIDEVQDLTSVQLALVLRTLKNPGQFIMCGDSHQIVHPNFFSWSAVKSLFWHGLDGSGAQHQTLHVLRANYRNTRGVTDLANRLLKLKQARFGSVDRESSFLVTSTTSEQGAVALVAAKEGALKRLDEATRQSARHAVIVLRDEDKAAARARFHTPLVFSVHEAKGLEYEHVMLFELVSTNRAAFSQVCDGVVPGDLQGDEIEYRRGRDKSDKSLDLYKFYVNALYVAMTRAVVSLTVIESDPGHPLLHLLGLKEGDHTVQLAPASSREEWAQQAHKLELQGKQEQAQAIRHAFLQVRPVPWTAWGQQSAQEWAVKALDPANPSAKPRQALLDYALWHGQQAWIEALATAGFAPARGLVDESHFVGAGWHSRYDFPAFEQRQELARRTVGALRQRYLAPYAAKHTKELLRLADVHGVDHLTPVGATPLMLAARAGNAALIDALKERGADVTVSDEFGHTAWLHALSRSLEDHDFAKTHLPAMFEHLAPVTFDVQTGGRLVRLERHQGEYWVAMLMVAGLKTQWSTCAQRKSEIWKYHAGFFADQMNDVLSVLPQWLWQEKRRKRGYINQVLARAAVGSPYRPSRQLWIRSRHGYYLPNPALQLREGDAWRPIYDVLNLDWIDRGCGQKGRYATRTPAQRVASLHENDMEAVSEEPADIRN
ncbi:MAG: ankyrin repeat domain-containing protein [Ramlibacter sp.]